ncbi:MAG: hypothetical protein ACM3Y9_00570 [Ignavibacteria bacterium]
MKRLSVTIKLELEVPEEWELRKTSEGFEVIQIGEGRYLDMSFEPLLSDDLDGMWTDSGDDEFINEVLDMVESEQVTYRLSTVH